MLFSNDGPPAGVGGSDVIEVTVERLVDLAPVLTEPAEDELTHTILITSVEVSDHESVVHGRQRCRFSPQPDSAVGVQPRRDSREDRQDPPVRIEVRIVAGVGSQLLGDHAEDERAAEEIAPSLARRERRGH